jgi:hypothetical protein
VSTPPFLVTGPLIAQHNRAMATLGRAVADMGAAVAQAAASTREAFALIPAALPPHGPSCEDCPGCYARCTTPLSHWWGCTCAPHGADAARMVARWLTTPGAHSHLVASGETECVRGGCATFPVLDGINPPPTPAEVLL